MSTLGISGGRVRESREGMPQEEGLRTTAARFPRTHSMEGTRTNHSQEPNSPMLSANSPLHRFHLRRL